VFVANGLYFRHGYYVIVICVVVPPSAFVPIPAVVAADYCAVLWREDLHTVKAVATMASDADSALVTKQAEDGMFHLHCGLGIRGQPLCAWQFLVAQHFPR